MSFILHGQNLTVRQPGGFQQLPQSLSTSWPAFVGRRFITKTAVYGRTRKFTLDCFEENVTFYNSAVHQFERDQLERTPITLIVNDVNHQICTTVVVLSARITYEIPPVREFKLTLEETPIRWFLVDLDGVDDYASIAHHADLAVTSEDFTLVMKMRLRSISDLPDFICKGLNSVDGWRFYIHGGSVPSVRTDQSGAAQRTYWSSTNMPLNIDLVYHITRSGATITAYRDGIDVTVSHATHVDPATNTRSLYVGQYDDGTKRLNGTVYWVRFYKGKCFSASEVWADYVDPNDPITDNLKLWLKCDEGLGTSLADSSGLLHHGTLVGGTWITHTG